MQRRYNTQTEAWYNYYYVQDGLGHTRLLLDGSGNVVNRYAYDAWGRLIEYEEVVPNPFTWNGAYGYEYIPLTGLYHVGAREYDPRTGRWLQRDPIEASSGDPNLWRYCGNDPLNGVDPSGLKAMLAPDDTHNDFSPTNIFGGGSFGFGAALTWSTVFENMPDPSGSARFGRWEIDPRSGRLTYQRTFHIDPRDKYHPYPHFNADRGTLKAFDHAKLPDWAVPLGNTDVIRNIGRGSVLLGAGLDIYDIATAGPCDRGRAIGGAIGGTIGSGIGAAIGSWLLPGPGTWLGGALGGFAGSALGQFIGGKFDPECDCP